MKSPTAKAELMNRLLSYDWNGDWNALGDVKIKRTKGHVLRLIFADRTFELVVRIPRPLGRPRKAAVSVQDNAAAGVSVESRPH